jgi:hypothetical protein
MSKLPERTRQHVIETESRQYVRNVLPPEWLVEDGEKDYGIDLVIEVVKNEQVTGAIFLMQLKGTDVLVVRDGEYIAHRCKTRALAYFLERPEPIVYLVYDAQSKKGYWIWIQDYIRQSLKRGWRSQRTATVRIPVDRVFDSDAVKEIALRALRHHERAKWLAAIEAAQNPYFEYDLEITEQAVKVDIRTKYPGAEQDRPVEMAGTFRFDPTDPEARAAFEALDRHFRTGEPAEFDARFFEGFDVPEAFAGLLGHEEECRTTKIVLGTAKIDRRLTCKMAVLDQNGHVLVEIPYIDFRVVQGGTEETTLSNEGQDIPLRIGLKINFRDQSNSFSIGIEPEGKNVVQIRDFIEIQRALARGKWFKLTDLATGLSDQGEIPKGLIAEPKKGFVELVHDLAFIQEETKQVIWWPGQITVAEAQLAKKVVNVLQTGQSQELVPRLNFEVNKFVARRLANACANGKRSLRFDGPDHAINLLGTKLSLGPYTAVLPNARPSNETLQRLRELDQLPDDAVVPINLDVGEPGVFLFYHRWLPQNSNASDAKNALGAAMHE